MIVIKGASEYLPLATVRPLLVVFLIDWLGLLSPSLLAQAITYEKSLTIEAQGAQEKIKNEDVKGERNLYRHRGDFGINWVAPGYSIREYQYIEGGDSFKRGAKFGNLGIGLEYDKSFAFLEHSMAVTGVWGYAYSDPNRIIELEGESENYRRESQQLALQTDNSYPLSQTSSLSLALFASKYEELRDDEALSSDKVETTGARVAYQKQLTYLWRTIIDGSGNKERVNSDAQKSWGYGWGNSYLLSRNAMINQYLGVIYLKTAPDTSRNLAANLSLTYSYSRQRGARRAEESQRDRRGGSERRRTSATQEEGTPPSGERAGEGDTPSSQERGQPPLGEEDNDLLELEASGPGEQSDEEDIFILAWSRGIANRGDGNRSYLADTYQLTWNHNLSRLQMISSAIIYFMGRERATANRPLERERAMSISWRKMIPESEDQQALNDPLKGHLFQISYEYRYYDEHDFARYRQVFTSRYQWIF